MNSLAYKLTLFADRSNIFRDMGSGFREKRESFEPTDLLWWVLVVAVVFAVFGAVGSILANQDKRRLYNSPRALFRTLCKAHNLDRSSRLLLRQMAYALKISIPARLFMEPDRFEPARLPLELRPQHEAIAALGKRLFEKPVADAPQEV